VTTGPAIRRGDVYRKGTRLVDFFKKNRKRYRLLSERHGEWRYVIIVDRQTTIKTDNDITSCMNEAAAFSPRSQKM